MKLFLHQKNRFMASLDRLKERTRLRIEVGIDIRLLDDISGWGEIGIRRYMIECSHHQGYI